MAPSAEVEQVRESLEIALRLWVDPVVADVGFEPSSFVITEDEQMIGVVYEADPVDFLRRYPQTRLDESNGDQWEAGCIDLWLKFYRDAGRIELDLEGFEVLEHLRASGNEVLAERVTQLSGDLDADVQVIADVLALVLGAGGPQASE
jgi:hypothetical protein